MGDSEVKGEAPKPKITSNIKEKNPGRVAAGKKLAAMNRARMSRLSAAEGSPVINQPHSDTGDCEAASEWSSPMVILSVIGVATGIVCLYLTHRGRPAGEGKAPLPRPSDQVKSPGQSDDTNSVPQGTSGGNLKSFD